MKLTPVSPNSPVSPKTSDLSPASPAERADRLVEVLTRERLVKLNLALGAFGGSLGTLAVSVMADAIGMPALAEGARQAAAFCGFSASGVGLFFLASDYDLHRAKNRAEFLAR